MGPSAAYDCQAPAALRSMLWSIPSRKRILLRDARICPVGGMCLSILMTLLYALIMHIRQATTTPEHFGAIALS